MVTVCVCILFIVRSSVYVSFFRGAEGCDAAMTEGFDCEAATNAAPALVRISLGVIV